MILSDFSSAPGIKLIGAFFILGGIGLIATQIYQVYGYSGAEVVFVLLGLLLINLGIGLYRLERWAYWLTIGFCVNALILHVYLSFTANLPLGPGDLVAIAIPLFLVLSGVRRKLRENGQPVPQTRHTHPLVAVFNDFLRAPGLKLIGGFLFLGGTAGLLALMGVYTSYATSQIVPFALACIAIYVGAALYLLHRWAYYFVIGACVISISLDIGFYITRNTPFPPSSVTAAAILAFLLLSGARRKLRPNGQPVPQISQTGVRLSIVLMITLVAAGGVIAVNGQRVSDEGEEDVDPAWSPDGKHIAFMSARQAKNSYDLFVMDADGSNVRLITQAERGFLGDTTWSPDGKFIAFADRAGIYVVGVDGSAKRRLVEGYSPDWSPDGRSIAYNTDNEELHIIDVDGSKDRLVRIAGYHIYEPGWSPDGAWIAVRALPVESQARWETDGIAIVRPDGTGFHFVGWGFYPSWSPDGQWLLVDGDERLSILGKDTHIQYAITQENRPQTRNADWSPDGKKIVFYSEVDRNVDIFVANSDGTGVRNLINRDKVPAAFLTPPQKREAASKPLCVLRHALLWGICGNGSLTDVCKLATFDVSEALSLNCD